MDHADPAVDVTAADVRDDDDVDGDGTAARSLRPKKPVLGGFCTPGRRM